MAAFSPPKNDTSAKSPPQWRHRISLRPAPEPVAGVLVSAMAISVTFLSPHFPSPLGLR